VDFLNIYHYKLIVKSLVPELSPLPVLTTEVKMLRNSGHLFVSGTPRLYESGKLVDMNKSKAVVFDIDGTLSPEVSWLALTRDLGAPVEQHIRIYTDYKNGKTDYSASKSQLLELWRATGSANKTFFAQLFDALPLDPAAEKVVQAAKVGRVVCLITGSMDLYAKTVAKKLGVDQWYANTTLHWDAEGNLVDMDYELDQAAKKLQQFGVFCQTNNLASEDCLIVGDGENDEKLFEACKRGVLLGGDAEAQTHAWKRIAQLADFEQIILEN
jgi:HAD superfamily phosphoserine phosphatase-like hydrolase